MKGDCVVAPIVSRRSLPDRGRARPSRGRSDGKRLGTATAATDYFPPPEDSAASGVKSSGFASRNKIVGVRRPPLRSGRKRCSPVPFAVKGSP